jgi:hypothetical protein
MAPITENIIENNNFLRTHRASEIPISELAKAELMCDIQIVGLLVRFAQR